jgi:hypothetical protein
MYDTIFFSTPFTQPPVVVLTPRIQGHPDEIPFYILGVNTSRCLYLVLNYSTSDNHIWVNWIALNAGITGITSNEAVTPSPISLSQNSPNPSMGITKIGYEIAKQSFVTLKIYDVSGNLVKTLMEGKQEPGNYTPVWTGEDNNGRKVINGSYFYVLNVDGKQSSRKAILLK